MVDRFRRLWRSVRYFNRPSARARAEGASFFANVMAGYEAGKRRKDDTTP